jgi:hypothetical protein
MFPKKTLTFINLDSLEKNISKFHTLRFSPYTILYKMLSLNFQLEYGLSNFKN